MNKSEEAIRTRNALLVMRQHVADLEAVHNGLPRVGPGVVELIVTVRSLTFSVIGVLDERLERLTHEGVGPSAAPIAPSAHLAVRAAQALAQAASQSRPASSSTQPAQKLSSRQVTTPPRRRAMKKDAA